MFHPVQFIYIEPIPNKDILFALQNIYMNRFRFDYLHLELLIVACPHVMSFCKEAHPIALTLLRQPPIPGWYVVTLERNIYSPTGRTSCRIRLWSSAETYKL